MTTFALILISLGVGLFVGATIGYYAAQTDKD